MRFKTQHVRRLAVALCFLAASSLAAESPLLHRSGVDADRTPRLGLEAGVGWAGRDDLDTSRFALELTPRLGVRRGPRTTVDVTVPVFFVSGPPAVVGLAPGLEATWRTDCCWRPSLFAGGGLWHEGGRTVGRLDSGFLTTAATNSPLVTFGVALRRPLAARTSLRLEARALTVFSKAATARGPGGAVAELDRGTSTTVFLTVGLGFDF